MRIVSSALPCWEGGLRCDVFAGSSGDAGRGSSSRRAFVDLEICGEPFGSGSYVGTSASILTLAGADGSSGNLRDTLAIPMPVDWAKPEDRASLSLCCCGSLSNGVCFERRKQEPDLSRDQALCTLLDRDFRGILGPVLVEGS